MSTITLTEATQEHQEHSRFPAGCLGNQVAKRAHKRHVSSSLPAIQERPVLARTAQIPCERHAKMENNESRGHTA